MVEIVEGSDVVDDDLISRIKVLVAVDVVCCIQCASSVVTQSNCVARAVRRAVRYLGARP